eukprot:8603969-Pyramimonas_sp.AAC.1
MGPRSARGACRSGAAAPCELHRRGPRWSPPWGHEACKGRANIGRLLGHATHDGRVPRMGRRRHATMGHETCEG